MEEGRECVCVGGDSGDTRRRGRTREVGRELRASGLGGWQVELRAAARLPVFSSCA